MNMGQHIMLRLADSRVMAPTPLERRLVSRLVLARAQTDELLAFGLADTHLHLLCAASREASAQLARRIEISLQRRLSFGVPFAPAHLKPIADSRHLRSTFFYILRQSARHGLRWDPLGEGSNLPDLLGLRLLGAFTAERVRSYLPRLRRADLLSCLGLAELGPRDDPLEHVLWATLAAAGLPHLAQVSREGVAARRALVQLVGQRLPVPDLAPPVARSPRAVRGYRRQPVDPRLLRAIRLQLGLIHERRETLDRREHLFMDPPRDRGPHAAAHLPEARVAAHLPDAGVGGSGPCYSRLPLSRAMK